MKIIDIRGTASASFEVTKSIQSFIFKSNLKIEEITDEQISIKVVSGLNGKPLEITKGFVPLKKFLLSACSGLTFGSDEDSSLIALVNLTTGGFIPLTGTTVLRVDLMNLKTDEEQAALYQFNSVQASYQAQRAHCYDAFNANKESVAFDFDVTPYDLILLPILDTISEIIVTYDNGLQSNYTLSELKDLMSISQPPVSISNAGLVKQHLDDFLLVPISGISSFQIRKTKDTAVEMFMRLNVLN